MRPNPLDRFHSARAGALTTLILLACGPAFGDTYTWDPANTGNGTSIDAGSGTWSLSAGNLWNNAGTSTAWAQTSPILALHSSVFAGADLDHRENVKEKAYNLTNAGVYAGFTQLGAGALWRLTLGGSTLQVGGNRASLHHDDPSQQQDRTPHEHEPAEAGRNLGRVLGLELRKQYAEGQREGSGRHGERCDRDDADDTD